MGLSQSVTLGESPGRSFSWPADDHAAWAVIVVSTFPDAAWGDPVEGGIMVEHASSSAEQSRHLTGAIQYLATLLRRHFRHVGEPPEGACYEFVVDDKRDHEDAAPVTFSALVGEPDNGRIREALEYVGPLLKTREALVAVWNLLQHPLPPQGDELRHLFKRLLASSWYASASPGRSFEQRWDPKTGQSVGPVRRWFKFSYTLDQIDEQLLDDLLDAARRLGEDARARHADTTEEDEDTRKTKILADLGRKYRLQKLFSYLWDHPVASYHELHQEVWKDTMDQGEAVEDGTVYRAAHRLGEALRKLGHGDFQVEAEGEYVRLIH